MVKIGLHSQNYPAKLAFKFSKIFQYTFRAIVRNEHPKCMNDFDLPALTASGKQ